jgi:hypothetical protein
MLSEFADNREELRYSPLGKWFGEGREVWWRMG